MKVGVVAIQGDFERHQNLLHRLNIDTILVKSPDQLQHCDALIIPGGESTTLIKLFKASRLFEAIQVFASKKAILGTCAGLIVLSNKVLNPPLESLQLIDIEVTRNAYGRQVDSFIQDVQLNLNGDHTQFEGVFIRAPKITATGQGIESIGCLQKDVVMAENNHILVATFHPELTDDTRIHSYFIKKAKTFLP